MHEVKEIKVLFIEDSEDDFELMLNKFRKEGYNALSMRVQSADELCNALENGQWDIILSDNKLPHFNASTALKITRQKNLLVPFIIVSGTINDGEAVQAMREGANDYLSKENLARLVPAIEREIKDSANRKRQYEAEKALEKRHEEYKLLAENIHDLVCLHDPYGTYIWVSPSSKKIIGYEDHELVGLSPEEVLVNNDKDRLEGELWSRFRNEKRTNSIRVGYKVKRKEGMVIYLETIAQPVYENDNLKHIVTTSRDITEQKLAYDLLIESESQYQSVVESIAEGVILYDENGTIINYNKSAAQILGLPSDETQKFQKLEEKFDLIKPDKSVFKPEELPQNITLATGKPCSNVILGLNKGLGIMWLSINSSLYLQPNGKTGVVISISDVTKQKLYEERVTSVAEELTNLIDTANAPIFGLDWYGKINEWNQVASKVTGYSKEEIIGKKLIDEFILDGYKVAVTNLLKSALRGKSVTNYELPIYTRTGKVVTILFNATPRRNVKNEIVGLLGVGQDITELIEYRERLEQKVTERTKELKEALNKEKELVALKSKFVSMASHEFRTPLSTINFAANYLTKYGEKIKQEDAVQKLNKIMEQVQHMTYLLDDVLLIGKSEAGRIKINPSRLNIEEFFLKIKEEVSNSTQNTHEISCFLGLEEKIVTIDEKLLRNIVINLLTNSIKFSPGKNKVFLDVILRNNLLSISVKDSGIGIGEEDKEKIFEAFHRSNQAHAIQGTGLGLSIVKKAVDMQNGTIEVESELNIGTTIKVEIPVNEI
ncbi:hybrid sensor histidine kinase/response regulator [Fulvivirga ligni]|uniref:hybrid sensor histidine kinase/response regulator n=1 Tax=Fulvivirga ligni TaxID=2904246 RepID=UPI001F17CE24|nr:PAS domain S-box protein [Fulvivirga ligni]UII22371.1 PAS domain S-box protein [Fulvivirga ligni]